MKAKEEGVVWVMPGGGNQTAYTCGVIIGLIKLKMSLPDYIVASSGGAANAFYFSAGQIERAKEIWTSEISTKRILSFWRFWKMYNRDAMVDEVFMKKPNQLKLNSVKNSKIKLFIAVTEKDSGKIEFFSNKDNINQLNLLKATMTVPFFSGIFKDISMQIRNKRYADSRATARYEMLIQKAIEKGAKKIIVLGGNRSWKYRYMGNFLHNLWLFTKNKDFRKNQKALENMQRTFSPPSDVNIIYLSPKDKLKMAPWDNERLQLREAVEKGYKDTLRMKEELRNFIKN